MIMNRCDVLMSDLTTIAYTANTVLTAWCCYSTALDYVVSQASVYGVKLILTLTNYYVSFYSSVYLLLRDRPGDLRLHTLIML